MANLITQDRRVPELDGLRGIAIIAVMLSHFVTSLVSRNDDNPVVAWIWRTTGNGWMGVDLFFTLSGFLITAILLREKEVDGALLTFWLRRAMRILPAYFFVVAVVILLVSLREPLGLRGAEGIASNQIWLWLHLANVPIALVDRNVFGGPHMVINQLWSLSVEEHFYLVWPLIVFTVARKTLAFISLAIVTTVVIARVMAALGGWDGNAIYALTPFRVDGFALAALGAIWNIGV